MSKIEYKDIKTVLTIAGSDSSGGAGIQADIKTILANGCYAMTAITALTAQNTMGVKGIYEVPPDFLKLQIDTVFEDIVPDAVKVGMVSSAGLIDVIADRLRAYGIKNVVVDPVMVSTSGCRLLEENAISALTDKLFPVASIITPNIPEAELLTGIEIHDADEMYRAGSMLSERYGVSVLVKGGHSVNDATDLLIYNGREYWMAGDRIDNPNTHGTGCTLSSAIASNLANGYDMTDSVDRAKAYISGILLNGINLGRGSGPLNHGFYINSNFCIKS